MSLLTLHWQDRTVALHAGQRLWLPATGVTRDALFDHAAATLAGPHGWLAREGGLLANLRVWENCVLPLSYFGHVPSVADEQRFADLLTKVGIAAADHASFTSATIGSLSPADKRLVSALRAMLIQPKLILVECEWFARLDASLAIPLREMFGAVCPNASWLALGDTPPASEWMFAHATDGKPV